MTDANSIILVCLSLLSVILSIVNLPGILLLLLIYIYILYQNDFAMLYTWQTLIFILISLFGMFIDNILLFFGVKISGGTKWGILGSFFGMVIGLIIMPPFGMILGAIAGAILLEYIFNADLKKSLKSGFGVSIGYILGLLTKVLITIGLATYIILKIIFFN